MITSCSSVVLVISMVDGGTVVGELLFVTEIEGRVPWDPGRDDEAGDGVKPGMQATWLDFPSAWMMMVVPVVGLPKWTKYKTRTMRAVAIRQANRHTRNVFQSDRGFAVTNCGWKVTWGNLQSQCVPSFEQYGFLGNSSAVFCSTSIADCCCFPSILKGLVSQRQLQSRLYSLCGLEGGKYWIYFKIITVYLFHPDYVN